MNELILNIQPYEKRLAVMENSRLIEFVVERVEQESIVNNIYKGIVKDILPGMGAAFIDIGVDRTAFLHFSDINTDFFDVEDGDEQPIRQNENDSSKITEVLTKGQEIIVQVNKGPIQKKGARLTGQISVPGKYIVLFPNKKRIALSKKISNNVERNRIKGILKAVKDPNVGIIVRTDAEGNSEDDLCNEYQALFKTWKLIEHRIKSAPAPSCIYDENDFTNKLVRDYFHSDINKLIVDDKDFFKEIKAELKDVAPDLVDRIELYAEDSPIFDAFGIEKEMEKMFISKIPLPSGGNIVIEQTEALVAIDINTGSYTGKNSYEETVKKTNMEAAVEVARQIRLRDLSGIVIVDFIDMNSETNKNSVFDLLKKHLKKDRAKNKAYYFGPLGLVEITRKRTGPGLLNTYSEPCPNCSGTGRVLSRDAIASKIHRALLRCEYYARKNKVILTVNPAMKKYLNANPEFTKKLQMQVIIDEEQSFAPHNFKITLADTKKILYSA